MIDNLAASTVNGAMDSRNTVHVWTATLRTSEPRREDLSILSDDERSRALAFGADCHRRRFVAARVALRQVLAQYLRIPPANVRFRYERFGKPQLLTQADRPIYFNLSHSEDRALIAVTTEGRVGIDVERVPPDSIWDTVAPVAARFFTALDRDALMALAPCERLRGFYQIWTRKEAHLKACGLGVAGGLDRFSIARDDDASPQRDAQRRDNGEAARGTDVEERTTSAQSWRVRDERSGLSTWRVTDLPVGGEYVAALALDVDHRCVLWHQADVLTNRPPGPIADVEAPGIPAVEDFQSGRIDAILTA